MRLPAVRRFAAALAAAGSVVALCAAPASAGGPRPPDVDGAGSGERPDARSATLAPADPGAVDPPRYTSTTRLAPGVVFRTFETSSPAGPVLGDLLDVDLRDPRVRVGLLSPGAVAARGTVSQMANARQALAGVNGDFFNISETHPGVTPTGSASGPEIEEGRALKAAVPDKQRFGPGLPPGTSAEDVIAVTDDHRARVTRLHLVGTVRARHLDLPLRGLNQYALPQGSAGAFTSEWGTVSRLRAVCGSDARRDDPCDTDTAEVTLERGVVTKVTDSIGEGAIPPGTTVLVGRGAAADTLRTLTPGERVGVRYRFASAKRVSFAVGGFPILRDGEPLAGLDPKGPAPRTAAGASRDGRHLYLMVVDGRSQRSAGLTVAELAALLDKAGVDDGVNLDGGGSSTFVARGSEEPAVTVRNVPSDGVERAVANGIGVFVRP
ncbi:phosphodiester glycosidase family protein [Actinomadura sp. NEAU-AAG7]|uniref:phosphodiester glycosidase family protein n=1 Tax=Actinomadura sp. NEAU-AAG7 TaxID=2839640 RepID=UPI001BE48726|nr:phosphodiester glycosidase family protein [Actinomadura sp. NEAU-AAG7]MBT2212537.1 phosphodiester glycosidase family protein [Actinomadura sp. NEAU-AAG7]